MSKKWIRRVVALLVLCLLLNSDVTGMFLRTFAVDAETISSDAAYGDVSDGDVSDGDLSSGLPDAGITGQLDGIQRADDVVFGIAALSEQNGIMPFSEGGTQYTLPETVEDYLAAAVTQNEFYIATEADFILAQTLCADSRVDGFAGKTLIITSPTEGGTWNIGSIEGFTGIGTTENPFKGTLKCYYVNGDGIQFRTDKPLIANMGNGAEISQMDIICEGSCSGVAENISGNVTISNLWLRGTIGSGSGNVGVLASNIAAGSTVSVSDVKIADGSTLSVSGTVAGGIAGTAGSNVTIALADSAALGVWTNQIKVTGSEAAGGYFGVATGNHIWDLSNQSKLYTQIVGNGAGYQGQYAGKLLSESGEGTLTVTGGSSVEVNVSGTGNSGGLSGFCGEGTNIVIPDGTFTISGAVDANDGSSGGVAGVMVNPSMKLSNYRISASVSGKNAGGMVGQINGGKCIIGDVEITQAVRATYVSGGVIGRVTDSAAVELQGTIAVDAAPTGNGIKGVVVGTQERSLIYLAETEGVLNGANQLAYEFTGIEEIGTYGGVYRNQDVAGGKLIGNGTLEQIGVIHNTVAKSGDWYQLTSAADFESLAIVLGTDGVFGNNVFDGAAYTDLLKAYYTVTANVDISYDKTGIITLNRNDTEEEGYAFSGQMRGADGSVTITQNSSVSQSRVGLFSTMTGDVAFSDLVFAGKVENAAGAGGIAYQTIGTGLALTNITMQKEFVNNTDYIGGVIAKENCGNAFTLTAQNIVLASRITAGNNNQFSGFVTDMSNASVSVTGVTVGGSLLSTTSSTGGFLGKDWTQIGGKIDDVSVEEGTVYQSNGSYGVMLHTVTNRSENGDRLILDTVKLDGLTVHGNPYDNNSALLIQDATELVAEIIDYDSTGCVVYNPGTNFDEVAGLTGWSAYDTGIISLHSTEKNFPEYHYDNKATYYENGTAASNVRTNRYTRYYYDVFQHLENANGTVNTANQIGADKVLDNPSKVLLWNIVMTASSSVRSTFSKYYQNHTVPSVGGTQSYTFKGELDLSQISYYPVSRPHNGVYTGEDNATIIFGSKTDTADMGIWQLGNEVTGSQHYGLQGGLFTNASGSMNLKVSDITLSGTIANLGDGSGALLGGMTGLSGGGSFTNITLDNLWIADYNNETAVGLLISKIPALDASFDKIQMINYPQNSDTKAAAALIGSAGGTAVTNLVLRFTDMVIADDVDGDTANNHNGDVLAYASFLYSYDYTDNAEINTGSGIYLFSEEDAGTGNVTYGAELDESTEFSDTSNQVLATMNIAAEDYKPYVYMVEKIEVNPKTGDILKGCGTYEDPYIIEDVRQFLTLYRYINEKGTEGNYQYATFYGLGDGWKVNNPGTDSDADFCETKHNVTWDSATGTFSGTGAEDAVAFGQEGFPTPEELSHAYYRLEADIDLTAIQNETYKMIADEFAGFGTAVRPFAGVWYGKGSDGTVHTVTLPEKESSTYSNYGFIQYAQGAVVKDIIIRSNQNDTIYVSNAPYVTSAGGSVIATILGGDNIIDNVTVAVDIRSQNQYAAIGGYVGIVKKGGLILRNVETADLTQFRIDRQYSEDVFCVLGGIVGKAEDGYVLYEGSGGDSYVWDEITEINGYPAVPDYAVLNGDKLKSSGLKVEDITSGDGTNFEITVDIPDAAGLQIMSMALNADALNVMPSDAANYTASGYTESARSRKADYSDIGCDVQTDDYLAAAKYDNVMGYSEDADKAYAYPYLYDYMGITGEDYLKFLAEDSTGGGYTVLNPSKPFVTSDGTKYYRITWELAASGDYDMTQFAKSFRGIGAVYQTGNGSGGTFHGNFHGNDSTITLEMTRRVLSTEINSETVSRVGLFNTIYGSDASMYHIPADFSNTADSGSATEPGGSTDPGGDTGTSDIPEWDASTFYNTGDKVLYNGAIYECLTNNVWYWPPTDTRYWQLAMNTASAASVFAASEELTVLAEPDAAENLINCYAIKDFRLAGTIDGAGTNPVLAGGVAACIYSGNYILSNISFDSANPLSIGNENQKVGNVGGLIGDISSDGTTASNVLIRDCQIVGTEENPIVLRGSGYGGGLVGYLSATGSSILKIENSHAAYIEMYAGQTAGGLVGRANSTLSITNASCNNSNIGMMDSTESAGGLVGIASGNLFLTDTECGSLTLAAFNNMGGMAGKTEGGKNSKISDATVTGITTDERYNYNGYASGIGGIVGRNEHTLTIQNASVVGTEESGVYSIRLESAKNKTRNAVHGVGGVVGCHAANTLTLEDCTVDTILLSTHTAASSGNIISVGGIAGYVGAAVELSGEISAKNLSITAPEAGEISSEIMTAGGCFGYVSGKISGKADAVYYNGLSADSNTVTGKQAGGLIGYVNLGEIRLSGATVQNGSVLSDEIAGGIAGYLSAGTAGLAFNDYGQVTEETVNFVSGMEISGRIAGGAFGYVYGSGDMRAENVTIQNCTVTGSILGESASSAGGVIGACEFPAARSVKLYDVSLNNNIIVSEVTGSTFLTTTSLADTEIDKLAVGGVIGKLAANSGSAAGEIFLDRITVGEENSIGVRKAETTEVKLVKKVGNSYRLSDLDLPAAGDDLAADYAALDSLEQDYGYYVGSVVGVTESTNIQLYMLLSGENGELVTPVMASNPPVVDVARLSGQGVDDYRSYCHIIYGAENSLAALADKNVTDMKAEADKTGSAYTGEETKEALLSEIRLSGESLELFGLTYQDNYVFPETDLTIDFPILVYRVQDGTLQEVMECITDVMTNAAGVSSSDMNYLEITCEPKLCSGTAVTAGSAGTQSISVSVEQGEAIYSFSQYDGVKDGMLSYTEITYLYGWTDEGGSHTKTFRLPVFVEEPILYSVHSKIMEGKVADAAALKTNGTAETNNNIIMANDSDYTLLLEYTYGKARQQMADGVTADKVFYLEANDEAKALPVGTRLLLIDVTGGNKAYYYTVESDNVTQIKFTDFKDSSGENSYVNRSINRLTDETDNDDVDYYTDLGGHELTETGVERFLLTVFSNDNDINSKVYSIHLGIQIEDENLASRFQLETDHAGESVWNITAIPGLTVAFTGKGTETDVSGAISKTEEVTVKAAFVLQAQSIYWVERNKAGSSLIDSSNAEKYLELAFYLRDSEGNRVRLPEGTNFSYRLDNGSYSENKVIPDDSLIYYYKDIRNQFEVGDFEYLISDITDNTTVSVEFTLDFGGADLSLILDDTYVAWLELLRTGNRDYPMGNGNKVDEYQESINASAMQELGFALRADSLEELAINTYPEPAEADEISGHVMLDFSEIVKAAGTGAGKNLVLEKWSGFDYEVTYQIYRKTENGDTVTYEAYTGDAIVISAADDTGLEQSGTGNLQVVYHVTADEIEQGNGEEPVEGVLSFPCVITQNTEALTKDADNLTNYMLEATLSIKENGVSGEASEKTTDFFIYTVTKLKTDL